MMPKNGWNQISYHLIGLRRLMQDLTFTVSFIINPNEPAFGKVFFGERKFVLSNFLSNEDLSISYES